MPLGAASAAASTPSSFTLSGTEKLKSTASTAARKVLTMYNPMTVRNCFPIPLLAPERELMTRKNTRIGATAFNAPTNRVPRIAMGAAFGMTRPSTAPMTIPMTILRIRLVPVYFLTSDFIFHKLLYYECRCGPNFGTHPCWSKTTRTHCTEIPLIVQLFFPIYRK